MLSQKILNLNLPGGHRHLVSKYEIWEHWIWDGHGLFILHRFIVCSQNWPVKYGGQTHVKVFKACWTHVEFCEHGLEEHVDMTAPQLGPVKPAGHMKGE